MSWSVDENEYREVLKRLNQAEVLLQEWLDPAQRSSTYAPMERRSPIMIWGRTVAFLAKSQIEPGDHVPGSATPGEPDFRGDLSPEMTRGTDPSGRGVNAHSSGVAQFDPGRSGALPEKRANEWLAKLFDITQAFKECFGTHSAYDLVTPGDVYALCARLQKPENRGIGDRDIVAIVKERDELLAWAREAYQEFEAAYESRLQQQALGAWRRDRILAKVAGEQIKWFMQRAPAAVKEEKP